MITQAQLEEAIVTLAPLALKVFQQLKHRGDDLTGDEIIAAFNQHLTNAKQTGLDELAILDAEDAADKP